MYKRHAVVNRNTFYIYIYIKINVSKDRVNKYHMYIKSKE